MADRVRSSAASAIERLKALAAFSLPALAPPPAPAEEPAPSAAAVEPVASPPVPAELKDNTHKMSRKMMSFLPSLWRTSKLEQMLEVRFHLGLVGC